MKISKNSIFNIIIFDTDTEYLAHFDEYLKSLLDNVYIQKIKQYQDFLQEYTNSFYDIVFISCESSDTKQLVQSIININKDQKIVILNNNYDSTCFLPCNECKENFQISRMTKPLEINDLLKVVKNEKCEFNHDENDTLSKLYRIDKTIRSFKFVQEEYRFVDIQHNKSILTNINLSKLVYLLKENQIEYKVEEDYIQVIPSSFDETTAS